MDMDINNPLPEFDELAIAYLSNSLTQEEWERFRLLLSSSDLCKKRLRELEIIYAESHSAGFDAVKAQNLSLLKKRMKQQPGNMQNRRHRSLMIFLKMTAAAAAIACVAVTLFSLSEVRQKNQILSAISAESTKFEVPEGSQLSVVLPDGTQVWMNSGSTLTYRGNLGIDRREINFNGEAYFEVAKDPDRPFIIQTDAMAVRVLGTCFNLRNYKDDSSAEVRLKEGRVEVLSENGSSHATLSPSQAAKLDKNSTGIVVSPVGLNEISTWREGKIHFHETPLVELLREIERRYGVDIIVDENCMIGNEIFSGTIRSDMDISQVLLFLDVDRKFKWEIDGKKILLSCR